MVIKLWTTFTLADHWVTEIRYHTNPKYLPFPAKHINLRGAEEDKYVIVDISAEGPGGSAKAIEEVEFSRALFELYEGGVVNFAFHFAVTSHLHLQFIHQGLTFIVSCDRVFRSTFTNIALG